MRDAYCSCWSRWVAAEKKLQETDLLVKTPQGFAQANPYLSIVRQSLTQVKAFLSEFGLSAVSRQRLLTPEDDAEEIEPRDEWEDDEPMPRTIVARDPEQHGTSTMWTVRCPACQRTYGGVLIVGGQTSTQCACGQEVRLEKEENRKPVLVMGGDEEDE